MRVCLKWGDYALIIMVCLIAAFLFIGATFYPQNGTLVEVRADGKIEKVYPLSKDCSFSVADEKMHIEVKNGRVHVINADCPDQVCVKTGWISKPSQAIVCLPNRVSITITGAPSDVDITVH